MSLKLNSVIFKKPTPNLVPTGCSFLPVRKQLLKLRWHGIYELNLKLLPQYFDINFSPTTVPILVSLRCRLVRLKVYQNICIPAAALLCLKCVSKQLAAMTKNPKYPSFKDYSSKTHNETTLLRNLLPPTNQYAIKRNSLESLLQALHSAIQDGFLRLVVFKHAENLQHTLMLVDSHPEGMEFNDSLPNPLSFLSRIQMIHSLKSPWKVWLNAFQCPPGTDIVLANYKKKHLHATHFPKILYNLSEVPPSSTNRATTSLEALLWCLTSACASQCIVRLVEKMQRDSRWVILGLIWRLCCRGDLISLPSLKILIVRNDVLLEFSITVRGYIELKLRRGKEKWTAQLQSLIVSMRKALNLILNIQSQDPCENRKNLIHTIRNNILSGLYNAFPTPLPALTRARAFY